MEKRISILKYLLLFLICKTSYVLGQQSCSGVTVNLTLTTDNFPNETSWKINHVSGNLVANEGTYNSSLALTVKKSFCLTQTPECYSFTISDAAGDGICCDFGKGSYNLTLDGSLVPSAGNFLTASQTVWFGRGCNYTAKPTSKPTISLRPNAKPTSRPSSLRPTSIPNNIFNLTITFDQWPDETSWSLKTLTGTVLFSGGQYGSSFDSKTISVNKTITNVPQCYKFTISDSGGDGMCCSYGAGSYRIVFNGQLIKTGGSFAASESTFVGDACSKVLTRTPTRKPSSKPTKKPTRKPTSKPTRKPTSRPTVRVTIKPSSNPTKRPTRMPTAKVTMKPTSKPSLVVTKKPTVKPTTSKPSIKPTKKPSASPSSLPSRKPTGKPTNLPTLCSDKTDLFTYQLGLETRNITCEKVSAFSLKYCRSDYPSILNRCPKSCSLCSAIPFTRKPTVMPSTMIPSRVPTSIVTSQKCVDASTSFVVIISDKEIRWLCSKISLKLKVYCSLYSEIRTQCPASCDNCTPMLTRKPSLVPTNCRDNSSSFLFTLDGVTKTLSCKKVALASSYYCPKSITISRNCPVTCGTC